MNKTRSGFTIVELLIVIVVIGILAAITIVAYNGVQTRAQDTQQITTARTYVSAFASYVAANGAYPPSSTTRICLGVDQAACITGTAWSRDTGSLEPALKTIVSSLPAPNPSIPLISTPKMGYVPVSDVTLDGSPAPFLVYTVVSPGTCTVGQVVSGTWPNFSSTPPSQGYTWNEGSIRVCFISLPKA